MNHLNEKTAQYNKIRLVYVNINKCENIKDGDYIDKLVGVSPTFILPQNLSLTDGYKVISYLIDAIKKENSSDVPSIAVARELPKYGFKQVKTTRKGFKRSIEKLGKSINLNLEPEDCVINLYTFEGDKHYFKRCDGYKENFDWYNSNVTKEEFEKLVQNSEDNLFL